MVSRDTFIVSRMLRKIWPSCSSRHAALAVGAHVDARREMPAVTGIRLSPGVLPHTHDKRDYLQLGWTCFSKLSPLSKLGVFAGGDQISTPCSSA